MEGVTGSNPVAPTTILAGQRCYQLLADSAPHTPRPRCGRRLCPLNGTGPPEPDDTRPTPAQQPRSVVTPLPFSPMVEHHAGNLPRTHLRGTCERLLLLVLPRNRPAPWRWTSSLGRPGGERGAAASAPAKRQPRSAVDTRAATQCQRSTICPSQAGFGQRRPSRSGTTATRRTRSAKRGLSRGTDVRDAARSGQRGRRGRGHRTPVCPDTWITPVAWTLDVRATRWTDVRTADRATNGVAGVRTSSTATTTAAPARRLKPRSVAASAALGNR
jgi:hypothetical protein